MSRILRRCPRCNRWFVSSGGRPGRPRVECVECNPKSGGELEGDPRADGFELRKCEDCGKTFKACLESRQPVCVECKAKRRAEKVRKQLEREKPAKSEHGRVAALARWSRERTINHPTTQPLNLLTTQP